MKSGGSPLAYESGLGSSPSSGVLKALRRILSALSPSLSQERNAERMASLCRLRSDW